MASSLPTSPPPTHPTKLNMRLLHGVLYKRELSSDEVMTAIFGWRTRHAADIHPRPKHLANNITEVCMNLLSLPIINPHRAIELSSEWVKRDRGATIKPRETNLLKYILFVATKSGNYFLPFPSKQGVCRRLRRPLVDPV